MQTQKNAYYFKVKYQKTLMALDKLPQIDSSAINSAESIRTLMECMNEANGFILREEVPDKGSDYDVELIKKGSDVSNWRFALQLKSIVNPKFIDNGLLISYSFETDRLGYLLNRIPAFGIIVLYNVSTKKIYFDYVDQIYKRLMEERESDDWKKQDKVNIHIPVNNELTISSVESLHQTFLNRFEQAALMQRSNGEKYNLPVIHLAGQKDFDPNNVSDVKAAIKKLGISFLLIKDIGLVYNLISTLSNVEIINDKDLLLIAALTFSEVGKYADSIFYVERIYKKYSLNTDENKMITFIQLKNQLSLGSISSTEFINAAKSILNGGTSDLNKITLQLNILYFQLAKIKGLEKMPLNLEQDIHRLNDEIGSLDISESEKLYFKIWNAENLSIWNNHFMNEEFNEFLLRESIGSPLSLEDRISKAKKVILVQSHFNIQLSDLFKKAHELEDRLAKAYIINLQIRNRLMMEISLIHIEASIDNGKSHQDLLINAMIQAGLINKEFIENNLFYNAYMALCYQIELHWLYTYRYNFVDQTNLEALLELKANMEREFEFDCYELSIPKLLKKKTTEPEKTPSMIFVTNLNDEQLYTLAEITMQSGNYPNAIKENIFNEFKSYQLFFERCKDLPFEILQLQLSNIEAYSNPVKFKLKSIDTGLESMPDSNMDRLLQSWGL